MTEPTQAPPLDQTPPADVWPQVAPELGRIYGFVDPMWGNTMIAMTMETWEKIRHDMNLLKQRLDALSAENIEYKQGRAPVNGGESRIVLLNPTGQKH